MITEELSDIEIANERVTIVEACRLIGMSLPDMDYGNMKLMCPFSDLYHLDGGASKAFRVYPDTNSAHCFAESMTFTPVKLVSLARGLSEADAAEMLLIHSKYVPPTIEARWAAATETQDPIDTDSLAEALKTFCARIDKNFEDSQFDEAVASTLRKCLGVLPKVTTDADAALWLRKTKEIMRNVLGDSQ